MSYAKWNIPRRAPEIPEALRSAGYTPLLAGLLCVRGIKDEAAARAFLEPEETAFSDPFALRDIDAAAARLRLAIEEGEHVAVYGDYDVDGITSGCMMTAYLRGKGLTCELYIPNRMEEGYGVNAAAIRALSEKGVTLIVTVDCGVTTVEETALAGELGVDMIITDHHECREILPPAVAVVDPKRPDNSEAGRNLAGVGVAFKLLCAMEGDAEAVLDRFADLVAVGTVADVVPLVGENRRIVRRGLKKLETAPLPGLRALMEEAGMGDGGSGKKNGATSIGFLLAPRLNAAGRLGKVETASALLLTDDPAEAAATAAELCRLNRDRQALETQIWKEAAALLGETRPDAPIVLAAEGWHQGVIGIVASRLTEAYGVPAVMICLDGEDGKGSCRSCGGFNLFEALSACAEHLEGFGGHALAAGLTIKRENIPALRDALCELYRMRPGEFVPTLDIDLCVGGPEMLAMESVEDLDRLEPCGAGNPRPLLYLQNVHVAELTPIGGGKHVRLRLEKFGQSYEAVFFGKTAEELGLRRGDRADAAFTPQINLFRDRKSVQLLLTDLRPHDVGPAEAILRGEITPEDADYFPVREDFALVWRAITASGGLCRGSAAALSDALAPRMREEKFCIILKVFEELGLLRLSSGDGALEIGTVPDAGKVDLAASRILSFLRDNAGMTEYD